MSTPGNRPSVGWFGKIPALGDFATRHLPSSFVEPWDEWLSAELGVAARLLAEEWESTYARAPSLAFAVTQGVLDARAWRGILLPSADRVGRQFPLTLAFVPTGVPAPPDDAWWRALVAAGRHAVDCAGSVAELDEALSRLPLADVRAVSAAAPAEPRGSTWWTVDEASTDLVFIPNALPRRARFRQLWGLERNDSLFRRPLSKLMKY